MDKEFLRQIDDIETLLSSEVEKKLDDDVLICECFVVCVRDIRLACGNAGKIDLDLIQGKLDLGKGCQTCIKRMDSWIDKIV